MTRSSEKIAIIGVSCKFPKSNELSQLWDNLTSGNDCITHFTKTNDQVDTSEKIINARGVLNDIEYFDADYFGLSAQEASTMDPQTRLFITHCQRSLENAGYSPKTLQDKVGVFASSADSTYLHNNLYLNETFKKSDFSYRTNILTNPGFLATRVSYLLNFTGPSINISVGCSSSLVGVVYACRALVNREADVCLAGGVSIKCPQETKTVYRSGSILSLDGVCKPFDIEASGTVSSNGIGVVTLKRLSDAVKDGDNIIAVISGYSVNNDGASKVSYAAPSVEQQTQCIKEAIRHAGITPDDIGYIEAHGTATRLGDMVEIQALKSAFDTEKQSHMTCAVGSIKSNIGHTDMASGIAGLIKSSLLVNTKMLVPTIHHQFANPAFKLPDSPFYINTELKPWVLSAGQHKRIAGVNSLGIGGTNAHVIVEEYIGHHSVNKHPLETALVNEKRYWIEPNLTKVQAIGQPGGELCHLYRPYWELVILSEPQLENSETWVIFAGHDKHSAHLIDSLKGIGQRVIALYNQSSGQACPEGSYQFDPAIESSCHQVKATLNDQGSPILHVVYLDAFSATTGSYLVDLKCIFDNVLHDVLSSNPSLSFISTQSIKLAESDQVNPLSAMVHGFALVASQELNIKCRSYDINLDQLPDMKTWASVLTMPRDNVSHRILALRHNLVFKREIKPWQTETDHQSLLEQNCHIVVTGGLGNIGLSLALTFAKKYRAHILLIAHKTSYPEASDQIYRLDQCYDILDQGLIAQLEKIGEQASSLNVVFSDVNHYEEMQRIFSICSTANGAIDYVFHLAAKIDNQTKHAIGLIDQDQVVAQLSPKLNGLMNLNRLTSCFDIKNVVIFSSIATYLGGVSMATYTSVNMAIDAYFSSIEYTNSNWLCLNWDAWSKDKLVEGGSSVGSLNKEKLLRSLLCILNNANQHKAQFYICLNDIASRVKKIHTVVATPAKVVDTKGMMTQIFSDCLGVSDPGLDEDFYDLGGDSLSAIEIIDQVQKDLGVSISHEFLYKNRSINAICQSLKSKEVETGKKIFKINQSNGKPIFLLHPLSGMNSCYVPLSMNLASYSCYCIEDPEIQAGEILFNTIDEMVDHYYQLIKSVQNDGHYVLVGYSFGGSIAHAVAKRLEEDGVKNITLFIIDAWAAFSDKLRDRDCFEIAMKKHTASILDRVSNKYIEKTLIKLLWHRMQMLFNYKHKTINSDINLIKAGIVLDEYKAVDHIYNHWDGYTSGKVKSYVLSYDHNSIVENSSSFELSNLIRGTLTNLCAKDLSLIQGK